MKLIRPMTWVLALAPIAVQGANKETIQLQRDVALLQEDVRTLQRSLDEKMTALRTLVEQTLAASHKSGTSVAVLESGIRDRMLEQQKTLAGPVANMGAKIDQVANDFQNLRESIADLSERMNKMQTQIVDLNNTVKIMSAPPAPPPATGTGLDGSPTAPSNAPPAGMSAKSVYESALRDRSGGNLDLASQGFQEYLRYYGNTELAPNAQFYIGQIHYDKNEFGAALKAFDAVLEKYPDNNKTADATYMKGMALLKTGQRNEAAREFLNVITNYPNSEVSLKAKTQRRALGLSVPPPATAPTAARKRK
ncbi:MAG TPA: tetratricopeptide repeat protein [Bryobacteraceae bacterium]|nr:tetratricopeptide repeat protein [Bryobacteraceae bacterium]